MTNQEAKERKHKLPFSGIKEYHHRSTDSNRIMKITAVTTYANNK